jgi:hypothetical protein
MAFIPHIVALWRAKSGASGWNFGAEKNERGPEHRLICSDPLVFRISGGQATAAFLTGTAAGATAGLFLLPGGLPRRFAVISDIHDGGLPRRFPRPRAKRSRLKIASSICTRSSLSSERIFDTSMPLTLQSARAETHAPTKLHESQNYFSLYIDLFTPITDDFQANNQIFDGIFIRWKYCCAV